MEALAVSAIAVAIAEIGDKTQLLALVLAARYRKPLPICLGIFVATLANHALAGEVGVLLAQWIPARILPWLLGASFLAVAVWALFQDHLDDNEVRTGTHRGVFVATLVAFFLVEMGDRTQIATAVLAAQYPSLWQVVAGTTLGMLAANVPVVVLGARFAHRIPLRAARFAASALFAVLGVLVLLSAA
jgi:putative Ca2+/H+ antiporter (TMEM165/GDT1 family)